MGNGQLLQYGIERSIRPGVPCPETVLVAVLTDGSYVLVGYPQGGPTAFVVQDDAAPLRQALEEAFGEPTDEAVNSNGTAILGHKALGTAQAQP